MFISTANREKPTGPHLGCVQCHLGIGVTIWHVLQATRKEVLERLTAL